ncbi:MAG: hypothetical protein KDK36_18970 [Leptospiraceae bacterium]|nr:hypothetical protein [Leptospiraceae bacterium]
MVRVLIFLFLAGFSFPLLSEDLEAYKDVSDKFFIEQQRKLSSGSLAEKIAAIEKLKGLKTRRALRPLISVLKGVTDNGGEITKVYALPSDPNEPDRLMNIDLEEHNAPILKFLAAQALAELKHETAMKPMTDVAKQMQEKIDENASTVSYTNTSYEVNAPNATSEVLRAIGTLVDNLIDLEESSDAPFKPNADAIGLGMETLKAALAHKHYYIRAGAADGLRNSDRKEAVGILNSAIDGEKNDYAKAAMLGAIIYLQPHNSKRLMELIQLLKSEDSTVRLRASDCLGNASVAVSEPYLRQALQYEPNVSVREQMKADLSRVTNYRVPGAPTNALYKDNSAGNDVPSPNRK